MGYGFDRSGTCFTKITFDNPENVSSKISDVQR